MTSSETGVVWASWEYLWIIDACMFFVNNGIIRYVFIFLDTWGGLSKELFQFISYLLSSQTKWNFHMDASLFPPHPLLLFFPSIEWINNGIQFHTNIFKRPTEEHTQFLCALDPKIILSWLTLVQRTNQKVKYLMHFLSSCASNS